ncbi:MAG TPA: NAD-dependent epimerase/dehydratase family protein [Steroidobacteraceae bacterium]|nr:NAD-dependent epimerase/dehydratase family protein [Steroidobacteraceae bacterium]
MKVALTGASGFLGSHVLQALRTRSALQLVTAARGPLPDGRSQPGARHVRFDLGTIDPAQAFDQLGQPDVLIHLAWSGLPNYKSAQHLEQQLPQQYAFLSGLVSAGLRSMTCTGTCFEYGMHSGQLSEEMPTQPANQYGIAKDALHRRLDLLRTESPFALNWARLFYMYGEGQPASSLYSQFMAAGLRGEASFGMSGGEQLRDFLPVTRVAELLVALALDAPGAGTVNICSGQPISVRALVEEWRRERGWQIALDLGRYPYPDYEPMAFWGSSARLQRLLSR